MAKQHLDQTQVSPCIEQVSGKAVAQHVRRYLAAVETQAGSSQSHRLPSDFRSQGKAITSGEQIGSSGTLLSPIDPQQFQQVRAEHHDSRLVTLAVTHVNDTSRCIDVACLERTGLADPKPCGIDGGKQQSKLGQLQRLEQTMDLLLAEHHRQRLGAPGR